MQAANTGWGPFGHGFSNGLTKIGQKAGEVPLTPDSFAIEESQRGDFSIHGATARPLLLV